LSEEQPFLILTTTIVNVGIQFDLEKLASKNFKTFSFAAQGYKQGKETSGIGIGLSTADALI
jgi:hypothetical protein